MPAGGQPYNGGGGVAVEEMPANGGGAAAPGGAASPSKPKSGGKAGGFMTKVSAVVEAARSAPDEEVASGIRALSQGLQQVIMERYGVNAAGAGPEMGAPADAMAPPPEAVPTGSVAPPVRRVPENAPRF